MTKDSMSLGGQLKNLDVSRVGTGKYRTTEGESPVDESVQTLFPEWLARVPREHVKFLWESGRTTFLRLNTLLDDR